MAAIVNKIKSTIAENFGGPRYSFFAPLSCSLLIPFKPFSRKPRTPILTRRCPRPDGKSRHRYRRIRRHWLWLHTYAPCAQRQQGLHLVPLSRSSRWRYEVYLGRLGRRSRTKVDVDEVRCLGLAGCCQKAAEEIGSKTDRIDIMILNAGRGIMTYQLTDYGVDRHMAVSHFGHVILASHLMPIMKKTAEKGNTVRIVTLGSNAHQACPSDCKFESLEELNQDLGPNGQYGRSKLAQMLYVKYLNKHLTQAKEPKILANTVYPGFVHTKMSEDDSKSCRSIHFLFRFPQSFSREIMHTPETVSTEQSLTPPLPSTRTLSNYGIWYERGDEAV